MAFKGLSARFEENADRIYGRYSARGPEGVGEPYLEFKPNDPARNDTAHDSRLSPGASVKRDFKRIGAFLTSARGMKFLLDQAELQTGNTFSETRVYNPLVFIGSVQPYAHLTRPLGTSHGTSLPANPDKSPASDASVGSGGRLQRESERAAIDRVLGRSGPTGLLNLLPPNVVTRLASGVKSVLQTGILGVNERPELNLDGQYFSIALWTGFSRAGAPENNFANAGAAARNGDIKGALSELGKGIVSTVNRAASGTKGVTVPNSARQGREISNTSLNGLRYFIVNATEADRYLQNSVTDVIITVNNKQTTVPRANVEYLTRRPMQLAGPGPSVGPSATTAPSTTAQRQATTEKSTISKVGGFLKSAAGVLFGANSTPGTSVHIGPTNPSTGRLADGAQSTNSAATNPAEERMLFGKLSLGYKYEKEPTPEVQFIKDQLQRQQDEWFETTGDRPGVRTLKSDPTYALGYLGGLNPGVQLVDDAGTFAAKRTKQEGGRYFNDARIVAFDAIQVNHSDSQGPRKVNPDIIDQLHTPPHDAIDFIFHDYVNDRVIPFRAILCAITENVQADFNDEKYIGRTERNIVYAGVRREISFTFYVQAFSKDELDAIWQKINYLTGLLAPSGYANGFMVPPFVQLTIGNLYRDQPGYISYLNKSIEDNTSWEIDEDKQIPMGATLNITFSVIEKQQIETGFGFHAFGEPQWVGK